jgi:hypothetical protein
VLHRTAVRCGFFLGFPRENAGDGAQDVQVQAGLWKFTCHVSDVQFSLGAVLAEKHTLALALVLCSRLSTIPELDELECGTGAAASWVGFLETVEEDMVMILK